MDNGRNEYVARMIPKRENPERIRSPREDVMYVLGLFAEFSHEVSVVLCYLLFGNSRPARFTGEGYFSVVLRYDIGIFTATTFCIFYDYFVLSIQQRTNTFVFALIRSRLRLTRQRNRQKLAV